MKTTTHLRPREKIAERAVHALSDNELLQVVIGSGSARFPVGFIARRVQDILKQGIPTLQTLRQVGGVGDALASRLVAVFELGRRLSARPTLGRRYKHFNVPYVEVVYADAQQNQLSIDRFDRSESDGMLIQRICRGALIEATSRLSITFHYESPPETSILDDLCLMRELTAALSVFTIQIDSIQRQWGIHRKVLT